MNHLFSQRLKTHGWLSPQSTKSQVLYTAWQRRASGERRLLVEAFCWLGLMRLLVLLLPFHWLLRLLRLRPARCRRRRRQTSRPHQLHSFIVLCEQRVISATHPAGMKPA